MSQTTFFSDPPTLVHEGLDFLESRALAAVLDQKSAPPIASQEYVILNTLKAFHKQASDTEFTRHLSLMDDEVYSQFPLMDFLEGNKIKPEIFDNPKHEMISWNPMPLYTKKDEDEVLATERSKVGITKQLHAGILVFPYEGTEFTIYKVSWYRPRTGSGYCVLYDIVFDCPADEWDSSTSAGHRLAKDVYSWGNDNQDGVWVYQGGHWNKSKDLWNAIQRSSWQEIYLESKFLDNLRRDIQAFFDNAEIYRNLGIIWKRGILLYGPPGNGKTESIKSLLKDAKQDALFVRSFRGSDGGQQEMGIKEVFDFARACAPCILVIEDLDSLIAKEVRSCFLNELDGIGRNDGILTIATTNHPEQIDDSILNRPSRFDVKYNFALPSFELREGYALKWLHKIKKMEKTPSIMFGRGEKEIAKEIARRTGGWSFAFLKELFTSFLLRVAHDRSRVAVGSAEHLPEFWGDILFNHVDSLSQQVSKAAADTKEEEKQAKENNEDSKAKPSIDRTRPFDLSSLDFSGFVAFLRSVVVLLLTLLKEL